MSDSDLRGGLIGCGFFAVNHLHAWREVRGAEIVAVCDRRTERVERAAREFSIPGMYEDAERMFAASDLDFVDVVTTPETHRDIVERVAAHGLHVICQKPMAPSVADGEAMVDACRDAGVRFMVHENFRWQLPMRAVKKASTRIGPLHYVRLTFHTGFDVYADQPYLAEDPRFIIYDLGVHLLDLSRFFAGEIERLYCQTRRVNPRIRGEDLATILMLSREGCSVVVELSYGSKPLEEHFPETLVYLEGREGTVKLDPEFRLSVRAPEGRDDRYVPPRPRSWSSPPAQVVQDSVVHAQQHWVDSLRSGSDPETSGEDNLRTLALVFGAYESAETGQPYIPEGSR